jgi:hypothetical protein
MNDSASFSEKSRRTILPLQAAFFHICACGNGGEAFFFIFSSQGVL